MNTLTLTPDFQSVLGQLQEKTTIKDEAGKVLGVFTPSSVLESHLYEKAKAKIDPDLIKRRKAEQGNVPYDEARKLIHASESGG